MKKTIIIFGISVLVILGISIWIFSDQKDIHFLENVQLIIVIILVIFASFIGFKRLKSQKEGLTAEDELSKKIKQKAASIAYYISLYLWLAIMYLNSEYNYDTEILFGFGIIGMAIIFALSWVYFQIKGLKND